MAGGRWLMGGDRDAVMPERMLVYVSEVCFVCVGSGACGCIFCGWLCGRMDMVVCMWTQTLVNTLMCILEKGAKIAVSGLPSYR